MVGYSRNSDCSNLFVSGAGGTRLAELFPGLGFASSDLLVFCHSRESRHWFGLVGWIADGCRFFWTTGSLRPQQSSSRISCGTSRIEGADFSNLATVFSDSDSAGS